MDEKILDDLHFENEDLKNNEDLKKRLSKNGIKRHFELKNKSLIVEESETVRIIVRIKEGKIFVKPRFPQIGNSVQIVATTLILIISYIISIGSIWTLILAVVGGQISSYLWHKNKIKNLKERVEKILF